MSLSGLERNAANGDAVRTSANAPLASGAKSGAVEPENAFGRGAGDADLAAVVDVWPSLPAEVRAEILSLVKGI